MANRLLSLAICGCLCFWQLPQAAEADGYPPFGAWAYGSGTSHFATWHRSSWGRWGHGFHHFHPRRVWTTGHYGWGGYGNVSFRVTTRYGGFVRPVFRPVYTSYVYPTYVFPTYTTSCGVWPVSYPVYDLSCYDDVYFGSPTYSVHFGTSYAGTSPQVGGFSQDLASQISAADISTSESLVATYVKQAGATGDAQIPADLLAAADAIFEAGGYSQAATAYARLNVQFGSSDLIFGRRFVAQIASGDFDQAAVIAASAEAAGFQLSAADLPGGSTDQLFSQALERREALTERLAAEALVRPSQPEPLQVLGLWLQLAGDMQRAEMFFDMARQLSTEVGLSPELELLPVPQTEFVSIE